MAANDHFKASVRSDVLEEIQVGRDVFACGVLLESLELGADRSSIDLKLLDLERLVFAFDFAIGATEVDQTTDGGDDIPFVGAERADGQIVEDHIAEQGGLDPFEPPYRTRERIAFDVLLVLGHVPDVVALVYLAVATGEFETFRIDRDPCRQVVDGASDDDLITHLGHDVTVTFDFVGRTATFGVQGEGVAVSVVVGGLPGLGRRIDRDEFMVVIEASDDEDVAQQSHGCKDQRADGRKSEDASEEEFQGADRFGGDRVDRATLDIRRDAKATDEEPQEDHQIVRRREHKHQVQTSRAIGIGIEVPTGKHHRDDEDCDEDQDFLSDRFLDGKFRHGEDSPKRELRKIDRKELADDLRDSQETFGWTVLEHRDDVSDDEPEKG